MIKKIDSKSNAVFLEKMIPIRISNQLHSLLFFNGFLNYVGYFFFTAFLNRISELFESRAAGVLSLV